MTERHAAEGRTVRLSRETVVATTLNLIDEHGIESATMRAIGFRLGVQAQSLYEHVNNREDLFDAVIEYVIAELDHDPDTQWALGDPWQSYLAGMARAIRRYALRHPNAFLLIATRTSTALWVAPPLRSARWTNILLTNLRHSGFDQDQVLFAYRTFNGFLLGFLLLETRATGGRALVSSIGTRSSSADNVGQDRNPTAWRLPADRAVDYYDDEFAAGVRNVIERIATRLSREEPRAGNDPRRPAPF